MIKCPRKNKWGLLSLKQIYGGRWDGWSLTLLVPRWTEQYLTAKQVEALGAGLMAQGKPTQMYYSSMIGTLLQPPFRAAAKCFARKYASFDNEAAITRIVDIIQGVAAQGSPVLKQIKTEQRQLMPSHFNAPTVY